MKIARFLEGTQVKLGLHIGNGIYDVEKMLSALPDEAQELKRDIVSWLLRYPTVDWQPIQKLSQLVTDYSEGLTLQPISPASLSFLPPVANPGKIICTGRNYPGSQPEDPQPYPTLFMKASSTLTGHNHPIEIPRASERVFCEVELALVIGKTGKHIPKERAWDFVAGFTIANDVGAFDLENRTSQWQTGKLPDTFLPLGPVLVSADEIRHQDDLQLKLSVNDQLLIDDNTSSMLFDIPTIIEYVSSIATLYPGDVLLTGSPKPRLVSGVQRCFIEPGDTVELSIDRIGVLSNPVVKEEPA